MNYEQPIIGALIAYPKNIAAAKLTQSDFNDPFFGNVLFAMRKLVLRGVGIDVITLANEINEANALTKLAQIQREATYSEKNIAVYAKHIKKASKKRMQAVFIKRAALDIDNEDNVASDLVSNLAGLNNESTDHAYTAKEMLQKTVEDMDIRHDLKEQGKLAGVPTGMSKIDGILGGFHRSDLVIVGARPAAGKTAYMLSCAINAAKQGFKVGIISTEMSAVQLGTRVISLTSKVPASTMRDSSYQEADWPLITASTNMVAGMGLFIYDKPVCTVSDIAIQAMAWRLSHGLDIVFIDYLTRIKPEGAENRTIAIGNIATDLKTLARTMNIPVVCLAQLSRELEKRADKLPLMSDLRDSGVIEQEADQVLMLYRDCIYNDKAPEDSAQINIAKNRHGATPLLNMRFKPQTMEWCDEENYGDYERMA